MITLPPFKAFLASNIPSVYDNTLSYYDELTKLIAYLEQQVVPAVNENTAGLKALKDYVENYFKHLDVQDEINNKLDEMAESGELAEIVAAYLSVKGVLAFDTPTALKGATNLIEGSYAKTYGYKRKGDGVYDLYTIKALESETDDGYNTIILTNAPTLVAIRQQCGEKRVIRLASTDNIQDYLSLEGEKEIVLPKGLLISQDDALLLNSDTTIDLNGSTINFAYTRSSIFDYDFDETLGFMGYGPDDAFTAYTGYKNITIKNGSIVGACSCFMHNTNVKFENVYFQTAGSRHSIQIAACDGFSVKGCEFEGARDDETTDASELINLDFCEYGGQPYVSQYSALFDGTKNTNIAIEANTFKQTNLEGLGYFSAIGTHGNSVSTDIVCDGLVIRDNTFNNPREYAIALKNFVDVVIENNTVDDSNNTYNGAFIKKFGSVKKASICDNNVKFVSKFLEVNNPNYEGRLLNIANNNIIAKDANADASGVFMLINIHDSAICGNTVQYQHHALHINTRAYYDQIEDNPTEHTINLTIEGNTFEKLLDSASYFGARVSSCDAVKFIGNNFVHDGTLGSNWQEILLQNTQTNLVVQANITDAPLLFIPAAKVGTKFTGNNAIYVERTGASSTDITENFQGNATKYAEIMLVVGETNNTQVLSIKPFYYNGYKLDGSRVFKLPTTANDGTYAAATFTISSDGATWAYQGTKPLRGVYGKD